VLAAEGATVLVHGHEPGQPDATVASIVDAGGRCYAVVGDVRTDAGTERVVRATRDAVERVDIVVNNFGMPDGSDWEAPTSAVSAKTLTEMPNPSALAGSLGTSRGCCCVQTPVAGLRKKT